MKGDQRGSLRAEGVEAGVSTHHLPLFGGDSNNLGLRHRCGLVAQVLGDGEVRDVRTDRQFGRRHALGGSDDLVRLMHPVGGDREWGGWCQLVVEDVIRA